MDGISLAALAKVIGAFCGGIVYSVLRPVATWTGLAAQILACTIIGSYAAPSIIAYWSIPENHLASVAAFAGAVGLAVMRVTIKWIDEKAVKQFFGKVGK